MGKASRRKAEKRAMSKGAKDLLNSLIKESAPDLYVIENKDGTKKGVYFNPLKKIMKGEAYKSDDGYATTIDMVKKYEQFLKTRATIENNAQITGIDPDRND